MRYINILFVSGDQLFRDNRLASLSLAIQYYTLADHLYGPPGQVIAKRGTRATESFNTLIDKWDVFGDAVLNFEMVFLYNLKVGLAIPTGNPSTPMALGIVTSVYFCVPGNDNLTALREIINDKFYTSQDIIGNNRKRPIFETGCFSESISASPVYCRISMHQCRMTVLHGATTDRGGAWRQDY